MRARYYNPDIKRFLNQDIKVGDISNGKGLNRYAYCEGNPVSMVDPFGLSPQISQDQTSRFSVLHNILDLAGLAFDAADVINAAFYAAEGDWTNAALCAVAVIPIAGSAIVGAAKGTKAVVKAKKAEKILELAEESCKMTRNASDRLDVFSDVMKASSKWGNSPVKLMDGITAETGSRAIKALETGGDFGRESKRAVQELKAVAGAEEIHLKPSVSRKVDVFKDSFVTTEKKVKSGRYSLPQGISQEQFSNASKLLRDRVGDISNDIVVQGSRAKGTAKPTSDIDIALRVSGDKFDSLINQYFKIPNPGSAKERTMLHAIETGKIQAGEAKLSGLRKELQEIFGMEVDISIIKQGGAFDNPPFIPFE